MIPGGGAMFHSRKSTSTIQRTTDSHICDCICRYISADIYLQIFPISVICRQASYRQITDISADIYSICRYNAFLPILCSGRRRLFPGRYLSLSADTCLYRQIPISIGRYLSISADTNLYRQIICKCRYICISVLQIICIGRYAKKLYRSSSSFVIAIKSPIKSYKLLVILDLPAAQQVIMGYRNAIK